MGLFIDGHFESFEDAQFLRAFRTAEATVAVTLPKMLCGIGGVLLKDRRDSEQVVTCVEIDG